jgi:hypothetical protein
MSQIKLNIIDQTRTISGDIHGSEGDAIIAALAAEPETIDELALAFTRFTRSTNLHQQHNSMFNQEQLSPAQDHAASFSHYHESPFRFFAGYENFEPYDAGILIIDLAARIVALDSTYSMPSAQGEIRLLIDKTITLSNTTPHNIAGSNTEPTQGNALTDREMEPVHDDRVFIEESAMDFYDDDSPSEISIPYHLSDDWLFVYSIPEYEGVCRKRREARLAIQPLDARAVLYGKPLLEFIPCECLTTLERFAKSVNPTQHNATIQDDEKKSAHFEEYKDEELTAETAEKNVTDEIENEGMLTATSDKYGRFSDTQREIISGIHVKWWMTAREDLQGKTPRQVLLEKRDLINWDLQFRELQWSFMGKCPPPLPVTSKAYLYGGFGTHEIVVYYDLLRHLIEECFAYLQTQADISTDIIIEFLVEIQAFWLKMPNPDYSGRLPLRYIELERQRIPFVMSSQDVVIDADCPLCTMSGIFDTPGFWHLDGSHMDDCFEFSFHQTREEWEAEQQRYKEFNRKFERTWREQESQAINEESALPSDDDDQLIH